MFEKIITGTLSGIDVHMVSIEVDLARGLPNFNIVGLPDQSIREAKERVRAAISNSSFDFPLGRITVNLGEGDLKKEGSHFDLPIALGILAANGTVNLNKISGMGIIGELSLDGTVNRCVSCMPIVYRMFKDGIKSFIVPAENISELKYIKNIDLYPVKSLNEAVDFTSGTNKIKCVRGREILSESAKTGTYENDFMNIIGQETAKRASLIAVAGFHHMLMSGVPGSGKTMIGKAMASIMPKLSYDEMLDKLIMAGLTGNSPVKFEINGEAPYDEPHHSISAVGLIGGGTKLSIGSLAKCNNGLILLDELPEFRSSVIQQLREPMQEYQVKIARNGYDIKLPCKTLVVATMNPCPCGYFGDDEHECTCSIGDINRYRKKISGPMLDRFDIYLHMQREDRKKFLSVARNFSSKIKNINDNFSSRKMYEAVYEARKVQGERFKEDGIRCNGEMKQEHMRKYIKLSKSQIEILGEFAESLRMSNRGQHKIMKLSRTIADIEGCVDIRDEHLMEACSYRRRDW